MCCEETFKRRQRLRQFVNLGQDAAEPRSSDTTALQVQTSQHKTAELPRWTSLLVGRAASKRYHLLFHCKQTLIQSKWRLNINWRIISLLLHAPDVCLTDSSWSFLFSWWTQWAEHPRLFQSHESAPDTKRLMCCTYAELFICLQRDSFTNASRASIFSSDAVNLFDIHQVISGSVWVEQVRERHRETTSIHAHERFWPHICSLIKQVKDKDGFWEFVLHVHSEQSMPLVSICCFRT